MAETQQPLVDRWSKTFIKNPDGTYTLRVKLENASDVNIGAVELKDALADIRATVETLGSKGVLAVEIVDASGNQITSFGADIVGLKDTSDTPIDPATETKQDDIITELEKKADVDETQPVSAAGLPLPTGAATSAKQLADDHNVTVSNPTADPETGLATSANQQPPVTTPTVYNVTLATADTEYSQALPANTREFRFRCRTLYDVRFAWVADKVATPIVPYLTLPAGGDYFSDWNNLASQTLFLASSTAGVIIEIEVWT